MQLRVVIKGQFVPFDARLEDVNKCLQLESVEKNLADTEKTPLGSQGKAPDPGGCTHFVRLQAQLTKPLTQPQRESADMGAHSAALNESSLGIASCTSLGSSFTKYLLVYFYLLAASGEGSGLPSSSSTAAAAQ